LNKILKRYKKTQKDIFLEQYLQNMALSTLQTIFLPPLIFSLPLRYSNLHFWIDDFSCVFFVLKSAAPPKINKITFCHKKTKKQWG